MKRINVFHLFFLLYLYKSPVSLASSDLTHPSNNNTQNNNNNAVNIVDPPINHDLNILNNNNNNNINNNDDSLLIPEPSSEAFPPPKAPPPTAVTRASLSMNDNINNNNNNYYNDNNKFSGVSIKAVEEQLKQKQFIDKGAAAAEAAAETAAAGAAAAAAAPQKGGVIHVNTKEKLYRILSVSFLLITLAAVGLLFYNEYNNYIINADELFADVQPDGVPQAICRMLNTYKVVAFIADDCEKCAAGLKELAKTGEKPVGVMLTGQRLEKEIKFYLNTAFGFSALPAIFVDSQSYGYFSAAAEHLQRAVKSGLRGRSNTGDTHDNN